MGHFWPVQNFLLPFYSNENLTKWDTSLSGTLFSIPKPKMSLTKWDTLLFETFLDGVFITFHEKSGFFAEVGDNKANAPDNEDK